MSVVLVGYRTCTCASELWAVGREPTRESSCSKPIVTYAMYGDGGPKYMYSAPLLCTLLLCQAVFYSLWNIIFSAQHLFCAERFSSLPSILVALRFVLYRAFVYFAKHFSSLPSIFLLCQAVFVSIKHFSHIEEQKNTWQIHGRAEKTLRRKEKRSAEKKTARGRRQMLGREEQFAPQTSSVHSRGALYLWATAVIYALVIYYTVTLVTRTLLSEVASSIRLV